MVTVIGTLRMNGAGSVWFNLLTICTYHRYMKFAMVKF